MSDAKSRGRRLGVAVLAVLVVVDVGLLYLVFRPTEPPKTTVVAGNSSPDPGATDETPTAEPPDTAQPSPAPTTPPIAPAIVDAREIPLSVLNSKVALKAVPGSCPDGEGQVLLTENGGGRWAALDTPTSPGILRVRASRTSDFWFIGTSTSDCSGTFVRSTNGGDSWDEDDDTSGAWHLAADPAATRLHAPDGEVDSPCTDAITVELEGVTSKVAYVLCGNGVVQRTGDAGKTWSSAGSAPGAVAMGVADKSVLVAAPGVVGCDGVAVQAVTAAETSQVGCVAGATAESVGLSFADATVGFLVAGESTWTTRDAGKSWNPA